MTQQQQVKFAFQAQNPEELSVRAGEFVTTPYPAADGWILCENTLGKTGYVPASYVAPVSAPAAAAPKRAAPRATPSPPATHSGVDRTSYPFEQTLGGWKERERKFLQGEAEILPIVTPRAYYYWDKQGQRVGPLNEAEMKQKFYTAQVQRDTLIAPITTQQATEALPKMSVQAYFPDSDMVFATAPTPSAMAASGAGTLLWLYLDDQGKVQGPFSAEQMRDWFLDSYFNADTRVKLATKPQAPFAPLGVLFPGDGSDSFVGEGNQSAAVSRVVTPPAAAAGSFNNPLAYSPSLPAASQYYSAAPPPPALQSTPSLRGRSLLNMAMSQTSSNSNPFESVDYSTPPPAAIQSQDDWGIVWGDEQPAAAKATPSKDVPVPEQVSKDTRKLAPFDFITKHYLQDHNEIYHFLTRALQKDLGTVRCKIKRSIDGMMHLNYNRYDLYLERDDGTLGPIIMSATKHKRMFGVDNYYDMQVGTVSATHAGTVIGETMLTSMGTQFLLHNNVKMHSGVAKDLACVHYLSTGAEGGPRKITVAIPGFLANSEQEFCEFVHRGSIKKSNLVGQIESLNFKNIQPLVNKPPVWSDKRGAWTLNFHGRVTRASVKNFQLCRPEDFNHVVLQHGRVGHDTFTMDVAWPMSIMQAMAVCLSSLHAKLGVE